MNFISDNNTKNNITPSWGLLGKSYRLAIKSYEQILILFLLPELVNILGGIYLGPINSRKFNINHLTDKQYVGIVLIVVWLILSLFNFVPAVYFRLNAVRNTKLPSLKQCYSQGMKQMWRILLVQFFAYLIIVIGLIAFIIPGVLFFRRYILSDYFAMDNPKLRLSQVLKKSSAETRPYAYSIFGAYGVVLSVTLLADLVLGGFVIGLVMAVLISYSTLFVPVLRYQEITAPISVSKQRAANKRQPKL